MVVALDGMLLVERIVLVVGLMVRRIGAMPAVPLHSAKRKVSRLNVLVDRVDCMYSDKCKYCMSTCVYFVA